MEKIYGVLDRQNRRSMKGVAELQKQKMRNLEDFLVEELASKEVSGGLVN